VEGNALKLFNTDGKLCLLLLENNNVREMDVLGFSTAEVRTPEWIILCMKHLRGRVIIRWWCRSFRRNQKFSFSSWVRLSPLVTAATTGLLYQPRLTDDGDCGAIGGKRIDRGNRSTWQKSAQVSLCPPQIPHDQTCHWNRVAAVGSRYG
jgi:hypothetical protein